MNQYKTIPSDLEGLQRLRRKLHANPETAHKECGTVEILKEYIADFQPDGVVEGLGGTGTAFVFKGDDDGPTLMFRAELDALPITETNTFEYRSAVAGVSHKCGHDGHMAIVAGLAPLLAANRLKRGRVILLFQPAEETGEGAARVLADKRFKELAPDYVFALHNLPGYQAHTVITRDKHFAGSSRGMMITLKGKTSHAAEPENGNSPALAAADIIKRFHAVVEESRAQLNQFALVTVIYTLIGEPAFGTTPGLGKVYATLRAFGDEDLELLSRRCVEAVMEIASGEKLEFDIQWTEEFPATVNDSRCVQMVRRAAEELGLPQMHAPEPFRWTEDFGHFTAAYNAVLFGLGAGTDVPQLHNPDYDFPETILETGISLFYRIVETVAAEYNEGGFQ